MIFVGLVDGGSVCAGSPLGRFAVERIDPDLDDVGVASGEGVDVLACFFCGVGTVDLVECDGEWRGSVGGADTLASSEEGRASSRAGALLRAQIVANVAVEAEREDGGDAEALELIQRSGHVGYVVCLV